MRHSLSLKVGPVGFRVGSDWRAPIAQLAALYEGYPSVDVPDFTVRLEALRPWRRWIRPSVAIHGDYRLPEAAPLPLAQGLLAAELGMNLQMALGYRRHLLLHAAVVERDGRAVVMSGVSGAGKSTLALMLGQGGWRFLGDEFALVDCASGGVVPFPRAVSLKNGSIAVAAEGARLGPMLRGTPKGVIRHVAPPGDAVARMDEGASPVLLVFPRFGFAAAVRGLDAAETFVRLTQASTNYAMLGEAGFRALTRLVEGVPAVAIDYPDGAAGVAQVEALFAGL